MSKVSSLGHVGIAAADMDKMVDFYSNVLGLTVTDGGGPGARIVFMSAHPDTEHHEFVLSNTPERKSNAQQISFTVGSLDDLRSLYRSIKAHPECKIEHVVSHGIAIGCYFRDPEGNRIEVYWPTDMDYVQPVGAPVNLEDSNEAILQLVEGMPPREASIPRFYGKDQGKRVLSRTK